MDRGDASERAPRNILHSRVPAARALAAVTRACRARVAPLPLRRAPRVHGQK